MLPATHPASVLPALMPHLGNGDGTFRQGKAITFSSTTPSGLDGVLSSYVNGDGKLDLLVSGNGLISPTDDNALYELIGKGDGTFQAPKLLFSNPGSTSNFATADFNKDGIPDLVEEAVNTTAVDQSSPATLRTYLGTPGGSYQLTGTFGPFPNGTLNLYAGGAPENPVWPVQPRLGDFNGDGNVDIAVFSAGEGGSYDASDGIISSSALPTALTILAGNGDGTFTQSNVYFNLGDLLAPQLAGNIKGDPRSDFVEMDSYSSSFDVISAQSGPHIRAGAGVVPGDRRDGQPSGHSDLPFRLLNRGATFLQRAQHLRFLRR